MNTLFMTGPGGECIALLGNEVDGDFWKRAAYSIKTGFFEVDVKDTYSWRLAPNDVKYKELEQELEKLGYTENLHYLLYAAEVEIFTDQKPPLGLQGKAHIVVSTIPIIENDFYKTLAEFGGKIIGRYWCNYTIQQISEIDFLAKHFPGQDFEANKDLLKAGTTRNYLLEIWKKKE